MSSHCGKLCPCPVKGLADGRARSNSDTEFMIAQGARLIEDGKTIFVSGGDTAVVAMLAQRLYAQRDPAFRVRAIGPHPSCPSSVERWGGRRTRTGRCSAST